MYNYLLNKVGDLKTVMVLLLTMTLLTTTATRHEKCVLESIFGLHNCSSTDICINPRRGIWELRSPPRKNRNRNRSCRRPHRPLSDRRQEAQGRANAVKPVGPVKPPVRPRGPGHLKRELTLKH